MLLSYLLPRNGRRVVLKPIAPIQTDQDLWRGGGTPMGCMGCDSRVLGWRGLRVLGRDTPRDAPPLPVPRHLRSVRHLKEADFVPLHILYGVARILRCVAAHTISDFLAGLHSLLALPKGDAD
jgi:hypothetical protein